MNPAIKNRSDIAHLNARLVLAFVLPLIACGENGADDAADADLAPDATMDGGDAGALGPGQFGPGLYASKQELVSVVDLPFSETPGEMTTTTISHHDVRTQGDTLMVETTACAIAQSDALGVQPVFSDAFLAAVPVLEATVTVTERDELTAVELGRTLYVMGAELENEAEDDLPTSADDPRVADHDGDGSPGVTVRLTGLITGDIYLIQRNTGGLAGQANADGRVEGILLGNVEQSQIGVSDPALETVTLSPEKHPDPQRSTFVMVPVADDTTCAEIAADAESLF